MGRVVCFLTSVKTTDDHSYCTIAAFSLLKYRLDSLISIQFTELDLILLHSGAWQALLEAGDAALEGKTDRWGRNAEAYAGLHGWIYDRSSNSLVRPSSLGRSFSLNSESSLFDTISAELSQEVPGPPTAIITHPACRRHYTCPPSQTESNSAPPENMKRLSVLIDETAGCLRASDLSSKLKVIDLSASHFLIPDLLISFLSSF